MSDSDNQEVTYDYEVVEGGLFGWVDTESGVSLTYGVKGSGAEHGHIVNLTPERAAAYGNRLRRVVIVETETTTSEAVTLDSAAEAVLELTSREAVKAIAQVEDVDLLLKIHNLESAQANPRSTVLKAVTTRADGLGIELVTE